MAITYGPLVTDYALDGAGNRDFVTRPVEVAEDTYLDLLTVPYELLGNTHVNGFAREWVFTTKEENTSLLKMCHHTLVSGLKVE